MRNLNIDNSLLSFFLNIISIIYYQERVRGSYKTQTQSTKKQPTFIFNLDDRFQDHPSAPRDSLKLLFFWEMFPSWWDINLFITRMKDVEAIFRHSSSCARGMMKNFSSSQHSERWGDADMYLYLLGKTENWDTERKWTFNYLMAWQTLFRICEMGRSEGGDIRCLEAENRELIFISKIYITDEDAFLR